MKRTRPILFAVLSGVVALVALSIKLGRAADSPGTAPATQAAQAVGSPIDSIARAADPSAAVEAYSGLVAAGSDRVAAQDAFVRRMVEFGVPELAGQQAANLNQRAPDNGLAWCVTAYVKARQGDTNGALANLIKAVEKSPDDAFVQRTAGQLSAWYEVRADRNAITREVQDAMAGIKTRYGQQAVFADAYQDAREAYDADTDAAPKQAQPAGATEPPATAPATIPSARTYVPDTYTYSYYYNVPYERPDHWWYPSGHWAGHWWGGSTILIVKDHRFHHDRHRHHVRHHDRHRHDFRHHVRDRHDDDLFKRRIPDADDHRARILPDRDKHGVILDRPRTFPRDRFVGPRLPDRTPPSREGDRRDLDGGRPAADRIAPAPRPQPAPAPVNPPPDARRRTDDRNTAPAPRSPETPRREAAAPPSPSPSPSPRRTPAPRQEPPADRRESAPPRQTPPRQSPPARGGEDGRSDDRS